MEQLHFLKYAMIASNNNSHLNYLCSDMWACELPTINFGYITNFVKIFTFAISEVLIFS